MHTNDFFVAAWQDALTRLATTFTGSVTELIPGLIAVNSGVPIPNLNGPLATATDIDDAELIAALARYTAAGPWSLQLRTAPSAAVVAAAAERGLTTPLPLPFMTRELSAADTELELPDGVTVRTVSPAEHTDYADTLADAFGAPRPMLASLGSPELLGAEGMTAYLVEDGGRPVATGFGIRTADTVGCVNIAVLPDHRRRGLGTIATQAVLADAVADGATTAYLHASPLGFPVYQRLGFTVAEQWTMFVG